MSILQQSGVNIGCGTPHLLCHAFPMQTLVLMCIRSNIQSSATKLQKAFVDFVHQTMRELGLVCNHNMTEI